MKTYRVQCGSLRWHGEAGSLNESIKKALALLPKEPSILLRVSDGSVWQYIEFFAALRIAGYRVHKWTVERRP